MVPLLPPQEILRVEMSQTLERVKEEGRREVNRKVIPCYTMGRQQMLSGHMHTTTYTLNDKYIFCLCVWGRDELQLNFIPNMEWDDP